MLFNKYLFAFVYLLLVVAESPVCVARQGVSDQPAVTDELARLKTELQAASTLDDAAKTQIENVLSAAEQESTRGIELEKLSSAYRELPGVVEQRRVIERQIEAFRKAESVAPAAPTSNDALTNEIQALKEKVELLKKQTADANNEGGRRTVRREEIRTRLLAIESEIPQVETELTSVPPTDTSLLARAKRMRLSYQKKKLQIESDLLKTELSRYDAEESEGILRLQLELYRSQLARQQGILQKLETTQSDREKKAAAEASSEAKKQQAAMESRNPLLVKSYEINTELAQENEKFVVRAAELKTELDRVKNRLDELQRQFKETEAMVDQVGLSGSVGDLLRQRKSDLPGTQTNLNKAWEINREVENIQFQQFDITRRQAELTRDSLEDEILNANDSATPASLAPLEEQIKSLLAARQDILVASRKNVRTLFDSLVDIEFRYRTLANVSQTYRQYLNERIFWIRSNKILFTELPIDDSDKQLLEPDRWKKAGDSFKKLVTGSPLRFLGLFFGFAGLIVLRRRLRAEIRAMGQLASRSSCDSFWPTLRTLFASSLLALAWPLPLLIVGVLIRESPLNDGRSLFSALGYAMIAAGSFALPVEFLRHICRENGLAQKHLAWSNDAVSILKRNLGWLSPIGSTIVFVTALLLRLDLSHRVDFTERLLFVAGMICLFVFLRRVLSPTTGIFHKYLQTNEKSWVAQTSTLWYSSIAGLPILLAALAIWGFYYTTVSLVMCAFTTFVFAVIVETLRALLERFVLVRRRHVHIESAKRKHEAIREHRKQKLKTRQLAAGDENTAHVLPEPMPEMDPLVDIDENAVEATKLIGLGTIIVWAFGLWIIWADVLPALKALDSQPVFPTRLLENRTASKVTANSAMANAEKISEKPSVVNGEPNADKPLAAGGGQAVSLIPTDVTIQPVEKTENELAAVTYGDLLLFLLITAITIAAARSLPGTLEMIFLNQLPLDRSVRYATKSLFSYVIVLVGMVFAFRALSIGWSNVQWLATALTFGLAFGLQEIFANFVAGIILMFERPMRIGDWITIDGFTGMVTKIRTRATTIVNLERKEFVIPNKDFITGRLVNWTLSDAINRIEIKVGVAYGSDVDKAKQILLETCLNHPKIVADPPPTVIFEAFGDSSLDLSLRAFLRDIDSRMPTIDELHTRINRELKEAGIEISFPQRDLHIRSIAPKLGMSLEDHTEPSIDNNKVAGDEASSLVKETYQNPAD